jgi:hypothetical protein
MNFQTVHTFNGGASDGLQPYAGVTLIGSRLYGTTDLGGSSSGYGTGTVYSTGLDGTNVTSGLAEVVRAHARAPVVELLA